MNLSEQFLNPAEAARRLGVSPKALRLYEQRGLLKPLRTTAGWRTYGPEQMDRAREIAALRALGLSLAQVAQVLDGDPQRLEVALATHQAALERQVRELAATVEAVRTARAEMAQGKTPAMAELARLVRRDEGQSLSLSLPWPWGGETFELTVPSATTYIVGPLGSGKTRLAKAIAEALPGGVFVGLDRLADGMAEAAMERDVSVKAAVEQGLDWLAGDGATISPALVALLSALVDPTPEAFVVDMVEQGLDQVTQEALAAYLRRRERDGRPLFLMTRSSAFLDLATMTPDESIILCPANHSTPMRVLPYPGAPGYEAVATCLASPDVRARTEGVIAWRPQVA